jgi:hypothetical protein
VFHLAFGDHMHDLNATQNDTCAAEVLEPEHRSRDAFDGPMVLLTYAIASTFVDRHRLGYAVMLDRFFEITPGSTLVPPGSQKKVGKPSG